MVEREPNKENCLSRMTEYIILTKTPPTFNEPTFTTCDYRGEMEKGPSLLIEVNARAKQS